MFDFQRKSSPIDIRVGGLSKVKIKAVTTLQETLHCSVRGVAQSSGGVAEQPIGIYEATSGAINRAVTAWTSDPTGDVYFGIESGIIPMIGNEAIDITIDEPTQLIDTAFIAMWIPSEGVLTITLSDGCEFPLEQFWQTKEKSGGFGDNTVGKTLAEQGIVSDHADPHLSLMGISREALIADAVLKAVSEYQTKNH
jgi:non-canonical (house-cleaning) NTP pyrophosphatase